MAKMAYPTAACDGKIVLELEGEIDLDVAAALRAQILDLLKDSRPLEIAMDKVTYIDSSGIACLVEALQLSQRNNLPFALLAPSPRVRKVLELARLDKVFSILPAPERAP
jgi:anti-sigma B factor antagonist